MSDDSKEKPKIIVDDDWKSRAQEEKEELAKKQRESRGADGEDEQQYPPPSLLTLISALATQATAALGRLPDPLEGKPVKRLDLAKHHIDMIGVLEKKTQGNLTEEEAALISNVLHELRMDFVAGGYHPPPEQPQAESPIITPGQK